MNTIEHSFDCNDGMNDRSGNFLVYLQNENLTCRFIFLRTHKVDCLDVSNDFILRVFVFASKTNIKTQFCLSISRRCHIVYTANSQMCVCVELFVPVHIQLYFDFGFKDLEDCACNFIISHIVRIV